MNQNDRVLAKLKDGEWLSMPEALYWSPPITRLGARIHDLRKKYAHHIIEERVPGKTYSRYKLIPPQVPVMPPAFEPKAVEKQTALFQ
jgi:hypothetical protein